MSSMNVVFEASRGQAAEWDEFVNASPAATGYHDWQWRRVFEGAFGHRCLYLAVRRGQTIRGVLPLVEVRSLLFGRLLTSLPFVNYGGILAESDDAAHALVEEAARAAQRCGARHVELRHFTRLAPELPYRQHKVTMCLPLAPGMWERIDRKVRNQIRKAQKSGLSVLDGGLELLPDFYAVFARNMRDLGTPVYPRRFFAEVMTAFPDRTRLIVVRLEDRPVAAALTFTTRGRVEVPWASSIRSFNALCPNHLMYWHAIERAVDSGHHLFDFGRSTPGEGTFRFKEQWGAEPVALFWEYWLAVGEPVPDQSPDNPKFQLAIEGWKRLPLWLANAAGPILVRGIP